MSQNVVQLLDFVGTSDKDAELAKVFSPIDNLQKIKINWPAIKRLSPALENDFIFIWLY